VTTSEDVREELARIAPARRCDRLAELSGLFHSAGSLHIRGGGAWALHLDLGSGAAARRAFVLLREEGLRGEIRTYRRRAFAGETRFQLHLDGSDEALAVLVEAGVLDGRHAPLEHPPLRVVGRRCCRAAYLRGAFLGAGSLSARRSPHLELRTTSRGGAELLRDVAREAGVSMGVIDRATHVAAYAKSWDAIESFLALTGAAETVLVLEERAVVAATSERANRSANADHANLVRITRTAQEQLAAIDALRSSGKLEHVPARLREVAELRARHPVESLRELAARTDPPVSRAAVHRRLRALVDLARS